MAGLVKIFIRGVGTLGAMLGAFTLIPLPSVWHGMSESGVGAALAFLAVPALIAAYMIWIGYLVWFRFSPRAVQQCCGLLGLFVLALANSQMPAGKEAGSATLWQALGMFVALFAVLLGYRWLTRAFNRVLFPGGTASVVDAHESGLG